ncbi:protein B2 [Mosinovirus]|nr:protein B2 [Mosinovirus]
MTENQQQLRVSYARWQIKASDAVLLLARQLESKQHEYAAKFQRLEMELNKANSEDVGLIARDLASTLTDHQPVTPAEEKPPIVEAK